MVDYSLSLCYGIIVSANKMKEIEEVLTDKEYDEVLDNYSRCIDSWTGNSDYFIGVIIKVIDESKTDLVYHVSEFTIPPDDDKDFIDFKRFFNKHDLWKFIDWEPELLLIDFCF